MSKRSVSGFDLILFLLSVFFVGAAFGVIVTGIATGSITITSADKTENVNPQ